MEPTREGSSEVPKQPLEQRLGQIASDLGFNETNALKEIRVRLNPQQSLKDSVEIIIKYQRLGEKIAAVRPDDYRPQIGLVVALAALKHGNGFIDDAKENIQDAMTYARNAGDMETLSRLMTILLDDFNIPFRKRD